LPVELLPPVSTAQHSTTGPALLRWAFFVL
jgi:hypothetical protein